MALALRLRRAIVVSSTFAPLFRPASAPISQGALLLAPFVPLPRPWMLPGAAAGFRSTAAAAAAGDKTPFDDVPGCDYNHWMVSIHFADPKPTREEMIEIYLDTLAKVVGSYEEAKKRMYAFSTTAYTGFQATMTEEDAEKFNELPEVFCVYPDAYIFPEKKQYAGDQYDKGTITPFRPRNYWGKSSRPDKKRALLKEQSE
ncbi:hypothetical protein U9M48_028858 [Paspalum notatum var. saurae]|uniref:MORF/ORRM1/DAG-like MORF domain-containing protein n=1 Tax=Paspalum notatum var. saurae TaxID=547442 RepID=A0AAQ3U1Y9_PASNO